MYTLPVVIEKHGDSDRAYDLYSRLLKDRIIFLGSEVSDPVANAIIGQLLFLEATDPEKDIHMYINSPGGSVTAGMAIYDTMQYVKPDIITMCVGQAQSMGCFLVAAGAPTKRYSLPHAQLMMHPVHGGQTGPTPDVTIRYEEMLRLQNEMHELFAKHTNNTVDKIKEAFERDKYLTPKEAQEFGIIDKVLTTSLRDTK